MKLHELIQEAQALAKEYGDEIDVHISYDGYYEVQSIFYEKYFDFEPGDPEAEIPACIIKCGEEA